MSANKNYAMGKPMGNNQVPFFDSPPAIKAIATTVRDTTATVSSILALSQNTTAVEVASTGGPTYIRWYSQATVDSSVAATSVITTGSGAAFDHAIPAASVRRFVVPISIQVVGATSLQGANRDNGLFTHLGMAGGTGASVIAITQYGSSNSY